jgi:hypothetical protein
MQANAEGGTSLFQKLFQQLPIMSPPSLVLVGVTTIACVSFGLESGLLRGILIA